MNTRQIPDFQTEAEEAKWWFDHDQELTSDFIKAAKEGSLTQGSSIRRAALSTTTIRLDPQDVSLARTQAERRGLKYQTYLKMLLHEALMKAQQEA